MDNIKHVAISNNDLCFVFESLGEYDSTLLYYKKNIANRDKINTDISSTDARFFYKKKTTNRNKSNISIIFNSYQGIATLYAKLRNYRQAYSYLQEGIEYAEETESKMSLAKLYFTAAQLFMNNHVNIDIALEYLLEAKSLFAELNNSDYLYWVNLSIGDVYFKTGNDSLAMLFYKEVSARLSPDNYSANSVVNHKIGMVNKGRQEYDSALLYFQKSIDGMCLVCPETQIHNTLIEAGRTHLILGNPQQAYEYLNRARNIAVQSKSGLEMVISSEELAKYYQSIQQNDSAIHYLKNAYHLAKDLGLLQRIKTTSESLSRIYYSNGAFQTSADYLKIAKQMSDSLTGIEKYNDIAKLEMRFDIEKREEERIHENQLFKSEITKQKIIRNTSIAGVVLLIIIGIAILRAYRRKRKDNRLLSKQKKEIQEISKQLQESSQRKLDFFTNISHEIRTPLTLIKSPLERILKTDSKNPEMNTQLQTALKNTNKLKELLNQILDLQKLDEKLLGLDLSDFELVVFCREIVSSFEGYCFQSSCRLNFESNISEAVVRFDQIRLRSIINNLLSNAFKYNKPDGWVQFNLEVNASQINLEIKDNGIGISGEHLKKLGERYFQIEQSNASIEGTGIGLAYVKELLQLMKGNIEFSSIENEGTSVNITLPCDNIHILAEQAVSMEIKAREKVFSDLEERITEDTDGLPRILIVEDNFELRSFLRDLFAPTYQVICAKDGQEGKEMALKYIPDLIISDIMMPAIKGNELCKILKNDINTSHITIILFTAQGSPDSIVDGYGCGADDYIVKPFDTEVLLKKVQNIISTSENARKQFSFTDMDRSTSVYSEFDKKFIKDCMSIIKSNIDNSHFTVEFLAEKMNIHRRTLLRKFNALTAKSPIDLIRHSRMSKAAELIKGNYRVNEVALMVGYEDSKRFSQAFKQFHGVSPSAYLSK
jgi:signal transduction histidine kinase/DNA-binding response OmpR family regulator